MTTYVAHLNVALKTRFDAQDRAVLFGQNVVTGSCLSGLTRGIKSAGDRLAINTPNVENTLAGMGFGLMMEGVNAIFAMKQQDFLLLGIDQLVNTWNILRKRQNTASFTILQVIVDSGYEGPQSALNNLPDLCSIGRIEGYTINTAHDADAVLDAQLFAPGFRIVGVSQRLWRKEIATGAEPVWSSADAGLQRYTEGSDATVVSFNFAWEQGAALAAAMRDRGQAPAFFHVAAGHVIDWSPILRSAAQTGRLVILDDSKSSNRTSQHLALAAYRRGIGRVAIVNREVSDATLRPHADLFTIDIPAILAEIGLQPGVAAIPVRA